MDRNDLIGGAQIAGGAYLGYKGIEHGLPRVAGMRIEYHTTSKQNADLIKKAGNVLDPSFGGKNGYAEKVNLGKFVDNSKGFVHITGEHKDSKALAKILRCKSVPEFIAKPFKTYYRAMQNLMYRFVGNIPSATELKMNMPPAKRVKTVFSSLKNIITGEKTKKFCIPGIDSYFNKNFIPDVDDLALKTTNPVKVCNNRFSAMAEGLKKFGVEGIKENKGRVAFGISLIALGLYTATKLINKGLDNIKN